MTTRGIHIKRIVTVETTDKKGNVTRTKEPRWFPCRVNAAVPFNHKMCQ